MIDRFGKEVDFSELFMEETLSAKDKKEIPDSMYGLVYTDEKGNKVRKFPLNDESHVRQAAIFFDRAKGLSDDQKRELARNIVRRAKELDMDYSGWESLKPYLDKPIKESYDPDPDSTTGTSNFDDSHDDPDDCFCESFEEMFGPVIQEAFDAVTGEEIPITKAYTMDQMKERTFSDKELKSFEKEIKEYLKLAKDIVKRISKQVEKDAKPPTGNQNCLLCTWCAEAGFRGMNALPRPVYSPCDPIFKVIGENIVREPERVISYGFDNLMEHLMDAQKPFARFYAHVNWNDSKGGHEFLILKISANECYVVDAQQGDVEPLTDVHNYFTDINWDNSYICRLDNKNFNNKLFEIMNDPKKTLPWNPKRDIPYMLREGLITKEEAERRLNDIFYKELKEKLGQTPIQESADSLALFKQLPKDLQEFLEERDFSIVNEDYGIDGYGVEEFFKPEFIDIAGKSYDLKKDDKFYNAIDFATDSGGNDFVFLPSDGYYYILDHEVYDELDHIHGDKLSSRKWSALIDPNHTREFEENERKEISIKYRNLTSDPMYLIITKYALMDNITMKDCNTFKMSYDYTLRKTDWLTNIDNFALEYKCMYLKDVMLEFMEFMRKGFVKWLKYDNDGLKKVCIKIVEAFIKAKNELDVDTSQLLANVTQRHKEFINKYEQKSIQEGAWNDIRNGVNPWSKKRVFHITQQGHLDGQIFNPRVPEYLDKYDPSKDKFEDVDNPRVCFSPSIEGALNAIMVTIGRWKTADKLRDWYVYIPEKPIDQYKHKTTKELVKEKKVYDANVTNEVWIEEPVRLKQYGIIRVDQVSDKHIKKTVPTTTGFQGHRYRYDFKYHWVVKPKVIADVPYDYTPMGVCKDMVDEGYNFKYGLGANGSVQKASPEEYDKNYRLESPEEFEKNGGGICFDFVEWQAGYLEAYGYTCRKFFISTETDDNMTHTFILVDDGNGGFIYPEISFELLQGVHEVKSPEEAIRMIIEKMIEYHKTESIKYYVWEYSGHPPYGSNIETCTKYFSKGEPFHVGTMNKPEKIK